MCIRDRGYPHGVAGLYFFRKRHSVHHMVYGVYYLFAKHIIVYSRRCKTRAVIPVSYTHLDVYKRQAIYIPIYSAFRRMVPYAALHYPVISLLVVTAIVLLVCLATPVRTFMQNVKQSVVAGSYTHLPCSRRWYGGLFPGAETEAGKESSR